MREFTADKAPETNEKCGSGLHGGEKDAARTQKLMRAARLCGKHKKQIHTPRKNSFPRCCTPACGPEVKLNIQEEADGSRAHAPASGPTCSHLPTLAN